MEISGVEVFKLRLWDACFWLENSPGIQPLDKKKRIPFVEPVDRFFQTRAETQIGRLSNFPQQRMLKTVLPLSKFRVVYQDHIFQRQDRQTALPQAKIGLEHVSESALPSFIHPILCGGQQEEQKNADKKDDTR